MGLSLFTYHLFSPHFPSPALCPGKLTSAGCSSLWMPDGPSDGRLERERERLGYLCPALPASPWHSWRSLAFLQAHGSRLVVIPPKLPYDGALVAPFLPILV